MLANNNKSNSNGNGNGDHDGDQQPNQQLNQHQHQLQQQPQQQGQKQLLGQQQNYLQLSHKQQLPTQQVDVRMKRHPELQPYVPSDRDRIPVGPRRPPNFGSTTGGGGGGGSSLSNKPANSKFRSNTTSTMATSKKCVSMTRLNQLAQPKKNFSTTSTTPKPPPPTTTTPFTNTNSVPQTSSPRVVVANTNHVPQMSRRVSASNGSSNAKPIAVPKSGQRLSSANATAVLRLSSTANTTNTFSQASSLASNTDTSTVSETSSTVPKTSVSNHTAQSSAEAMEAFDGANIVTQSSPTASTASAKTAPPPSPIASEANTTFTTPIASVNNTTFTTNGTGNSHPRNIDSFCHDLEADLIAEGLVKPNLVPPKIDDNEDSSKDGGDKTFKIEEQFRESARREEEERQSRQLIVTNILSKLHQTP